LFEHVARKRLAIPRVAGIAVDDILVGNERIDRRGVSFVPDQLHESVERLSIVSHGRGVNSERWSHQQETKMTTWALLDARSAASSPSHRCHFARNSSASS